MSWGRRRRSWGAPPAEGNCVRATQEDQGSSGGPPRGWQRLVTWSAASSCFLFSACCFATFCSHACLAVTCAWNCAGGCRSQQPLSTAWFARQLAAPARATHRARTAPPWRDPLAEGGAVPPVRAKRWRQRLRARGAGHADTSAAPACRTHLCVSALSLSFSASVPALPAGTEAEPTLNPNILRSDLRLDLDII